jgi:hypothetical protein
MEYVQLAGQHRGVGIGLGRGHVSPRTVGPEQDLTKNCSPWDPTLAGVGTSGTAPGRAVERDCTQQVWPLPPGRIWISEFL